MARDPDIERRLENWARWKGGAGAGGIGYASAQLGLSAGGSSGYREAVIPVWDNEAAVTDQAVQALDESLREVIEASYLPPAGTVVAVAHALDIAVRTLHQRMERAFMALRIWFAERESAQAMERRRVESLTNRT
jgi:hypothetical protein